MESLTVSGIFHIQSHCCHATDDVVVLRLQLFEDRLRPFIKLYRWLMSAVSERASVWQCWIIQQVGRNGDVSYWSPLAAGMYSSFSQVKGSRLSSTDSRDTLWCPILRDDWARPSLVISWPVARCGYMESLGATSGTPQPAVYRFWVRRPEYRYSQRRKIPSSGTFGIWPEWYPV